MKIFINLLMKENQILFIQIKKVSRRPCNIIRNFPIKKKYPIIDYIHKHIYKIFITVIRKIYELNIRIPIIIIKNIFFFKFND